MIIENMSHNKILATKAQIANTFFTRLKGLLGTKKLDKGKALVIRPCNSIHTIGMNYDIDVLFVDSSDNVIKVINKMPASRFSLCPKSFYVIELPAGTIEATGTVAGDKISLTGDSNMLKNTYNFKI